MLSYSWLIGFGDNYPEYIWHKPSYNAAIDWPLRGVTIFANWTAQQTSGSFKQLLTAQASKFDMEGGRFETLLSPKWANTGLSSVLNPCKG